MRDAVPPDPLADEVRRLFDTLPLWEGKVVVREMIGPHLAWQGEVHSYRLLDHPRAVTCFAWESDTKAGGKRIHTALAIPPIVTASDAVRAEIAADNASGKA